MHIDQSRAVAHCRFVMLLLLMHTWLVRVDLSESHSVTRLPPLKM